MSSGNDFFKKPGGSSGFSSDSFSKSIDFGDAKDKSIDRTGESKIKMSAGFKKNKEETKQETVTYSKSFDNKSELPKKESINSQPAREPKPQKPQSAVTKDVKPLNQKPEQQKNEPQQKNSKHNPSNTNGEKVNITLRMNEVTQKKLDETIKLLESLKLPVHAANVAELMGNIVKDRFTVAVVGEFSKGKSTFINNLFEKEVLPVGNTPTTAMLTRIMYNSKEALVISDGKNPKITMPLSPKSWEGYTADLDGKDPTGVAFVGLDDQWLKHGIEIIDTPGAGDLEEKRAALIGDALKGSDAAVITISAEVAMSMSEKLFIEERLISKKTPFLMLIVTKLDRIDEKQRSGVVRFIKQKLEMWNINVPVFIPYDVKIPGGEFEDIIGMDKVKSQIDSWIVAPERVKLTCEWVAQRVKAVLASAISELNEKKLIADADDNEKDKLISRKKELIDKAKNEWESLRLGMLERSNDAYKKLLIRADDFKKTLTERLSHELSHSSNPQKWLAEDYPYRMKIELSNFSASTEGFISKKIADDARWFNTNLDKSFKTNVLFSPDKYESVVPREVATGAESVLKLKDLTAARTVSRVGVSALSIIGFMACSSIGIPPIIGSTGITTGGTVISEVFFKKKIDSQRQTIKQEIEKNIPVIISKSMVHTEKRVKNMYDDIISEAHKLEKSWMENQLGAIPTDNTEPGKMDTAHISNAISLLEKQILNWD
ncbi:MAG: dynamin family protein [Clostridia bacterium]|nr:dynamin family protein [Clostridia bacterium]